MRTTATQRQCRFPSIGRVRLSPLDHGQQHRHAGADQGRKRRDEAHRAARQRAGRRRPGRQRPRCPRAPPTPTTRRRGIGSRGRDEDQHGYDEADALAGEHRHEDAGVSGDESAAEVAGAPRDGGGEAEERACADQRSSGQSGAGSAVSGAGSRRCRRRMTVAIAACPLPLAAGSAGSCAGSCRSTTSSASRPVRPAATASGSSRSVGAASADHAVGHGVVAVGRRQVDHLVVARDVLEQRQGAPWRGRRRK